MTYDVVSSHLSDGSIRCLSVWTLSVSAGLTFMLAFAVTQGASFKCWLAAVRWVQRLFLCGLSVAMAYGAAFILDYAYTPPGPFVIMFVVTMISIVLSGIRHMSAPPISPDNSWRGGWAVIKQNMRKLLPLHDHRHTVQPRGVPRV